MSVTPEGASNPAQQYSKAVVRLVCQSCHNVDMDELKIMLRGALHRARYLLSRFSVDRCSENAAALTYMSLFALVPLLTVLYTMASAIPTFQGLEEQMQTLLFENLMPDTSAEVESYLTDFSQQAKNLTGPGIVFLVITAVLMLRNIEKAFNQIWRASENRSAVSSFLLYWAVLSLAPVAMGIALGLSTYLASFSHVLDEYDIFGAKAWRRPWVFTWRDRCSPTWWWVPATRLFMVPSPLCRCSCYGSIFHGTSY